MTSIRLKYKYVTAATGLSDDLRKCDQRRSQHSIKKKNLISLNSFAIRNPIYTDKIHPVVAVFRTALLHAFSVDSPLRADYFVCFQPGKIHISTTTRQLLGDRYVTESRGLVTVKVRT
jgi:hypothetical protein